MQPTTPRTVTLRTRFGAIKGQVDLVKVYHLGLRHARTGFFNALVGVDAAGVIYKTTSSGNWTTAHTLALSWGGRVPEADRLAMQIAEFEGAQ